MHTLTRSFFLMTGLCGVLLAGGCAAMDQAYQQQQADNARQCSQNYGLQPGSDPYVQCVAQGPQAYAAAVAAKANAAANAPPAGVVPVMPVIGIPVVAPPAKNNACSAPKSSPQGSCAGCSVSCGAKSASCTPGQEIPGGSAICITEASCSCQ